MIRNKWIIVCLLFLTAGLAKAQQNTDSLLIGPGDVIHIQVFDTPEMEQRQRVTDSGFVNLSIGGAVKVSGLTPADAANAIAEVLKDKGLVLHPSVTVGVEEFATEKVSILGEVRAPGAFAIVTPRSIVEVLALAGGLTEIADRKIFIQRHGSTERVPFFVSNKPNEVFDTAATIYPGDSIFVPRAGIIYGLGDLRAPGGYALTNNEGQLTVLQLVARCGGAQNTAAAPHSKLIRKDKDGYVEIPIDLRAMQNGKASDVFLQPGDILYVPFSYVRNLALTATSVVAAASEAAVIRF